MNPYLEKLKRAAEKGPPQQLSKLPKAPFDSFGSAYGTPFSPERADFEERAAVCEFDGGLTRAHAEALAAIEAAFLPGGITAEQRSTVIDAAARFLDARRKASAGHG